MCLHCLGLVNSLSSWLSCEERHQSAFVCCHLSTQNSRTLVRACGQSFCGLYVAHVHIICPICDITREKMYQALFHYCTASDGKLGKVLRRPKNVVIYMCQSCRNQTLFYHVWQSRVKLEGSYFDHIAALNEPYC